MSRRVKHWIVFFLLPYAVQTLGTSVTEKRWRVSSQWRNERRKTTGSKWRGQGRSSWSRRCFNLWSQARWRALTPIFIYSIWRVMEICDRASPWFGAWMNVGSHCDVGMKEVPFFFLVKEKNWWTEINRGLEIGLAPSLPIPMSELISSRWRWVRNMKKQVGVNYCS